MSKQSKTSCFGALNGVILLQGQVPMAVARDGLLPKVFIDKKVMAFQVVR